jgi:hypothetical protein
LLETISGKLVVVETQLADAIAADDMTAVQAGKDALTTFRTAIDDDTDTICSAIEYGTPVCAVWGS